MDVSLSLYDDKNPLPNQPGINLEDEIRVASRVLDDDDISYDHLSNLDLLANASAPNSGLNEALASSSQPNEALAPFPGFSEMSELTSLGVSAYDHSQLERNIMGNMEEELRIYNEAERQMKTATASKKLRAVEEDIRLVNQRLSHLDRIISLALTDPSQLTDNEIRELPAIKMEKQNKLNHLRKIEAKRKTLQAHLFGSTSEVSNNMQGEAIDAVAPEESEIDRLIRTGEITPSRTRGIYMPENTAFDRYLLDSAKIHAAKKASKKTARRPAASIEKTKSNSTVVIRNDKTNLQFTDVKAAPVKRKRSNLLKLQKEGAHDKPSKSGKNPSKKKRKNSLVKNYKSDSEVSCFEEEDHKPQYSDSDVYVPDEDSEDDDDYKDYFIQKKKKERGKKKEGDKSVNSGCESRETKSRVKKLIDDGPQTRFLKRVKEYNKSELKRKHRRIMEREDGVVDSDEEDFTDIDDGFKVPNSIWNKLYKYQQTCVRWLWELHQQNCGGIIGDEMGLGKTVQVIAFLAGLSTSNIRAEGDNFRGMGPVILVCPATVMHQWVKEFHKWWPPFRVAILHESGSYKGKKGTLISLINKYQGVLVVSYAGLVKHQEKLLSHEWHYIILDEGHKIRNPYTQVTIVAKMFRTCHRLILSGSPIQNNLTELWSLFDFVYPGKLGTLPVFKEQFSTPIMQGGYANATNFQVQTGYKCAMVLRDSIKPFLLRRMKSDVKMHINLPSKNEQVLFCKLTEKQINLYKGYVDSKEVNKILNGKLQVFVGLMNLRKICNHPDLFDGGPRVFKHTDISQLGEEEKFGFYGHSGKMVVVEALLRMWHKQGHRVLLFTQGRKMLHILVTFLESRNYSFMKMDGTTPIASRQPAIQKFNSDPNLFVFVLTTRVGGLGVNLTGADRVVLFDPDWNPSTDTQARERAWRIGQNRQVTIYRLLTAGTIEEKIYHRQIFKQFVTNRVLKDPKQQRFFKSNDLFELFSYKELGTQGTETSAIFAGTGSEIRPKQKVRKESTSKDLIKDMPEIGTFSEEKIKEMRHLAKRLAMSLTSPEVKLGNSIEINSKNDPETQSVAILGSDLKSKCDPDSKSETSLGLMPNNVPIAKAETTLGLEMNSNKTGEDSLLDKTISVKRASKKKDLKDKLNNKKSRNTHSEDKTPKKV